MAAYAPHPANAATVPTPPTAGSAHTGPGPSAATAQTPQAASSSGPYTAEVAAAASPPPTTSAATGPTPTRGAPGTPAAHGSQAHTRLLPHDAVRFTADESLQSTPQRKHKAARTEGADTAGPELMEGTGLSFSPSTLRTVALPHVYPHKASVAMGHYVAENTAGPATQVTARRGWCYKPRGDTPHNHSMEIVDRVIMAVATQY